ncbi:unnamed protein product [Paramecium sonneborni]|uniref:Uncharacterized protein n=1 Tax=Paramecium sonneborni TaxID=65129 RepID=A0A8S1R9A3_9CILI|nr:unnamed protein product [Paramecium sonneborni]
MTSLNAFKIKQNINEQPYRVGVAYCCLIDKCKSMKGQKLSMFKQTLV